MDYLEYKKKRHALSDADTCETDYNNRTMRVYPVGYKDGTSVEILSEKLSREGYLALRKVAEDYETNHKELGFEFTEEDYDLFEEHYEQAMETLEYADGDFPESMLDEMSNIAKSQGYEYSAEKMKDTARYLFENMLNEGRPRNASSTAFVKVEIDLYDGHYVNISLDGPSAAGYDEECDEW
jgi:hypothetical protein